MNERKVQGCANGRQESYQKVNLGKKNSFTCQSLTETAGAGEAVNRCFELNVCGPCPFREQEGDDGTSKSQGKPQVCGAGGLGGLAVEDKIIFFFSL